MELKIGDETVRFPHLFEEDLASYVERYGEHVVLHWIELHLRRRASDYIRHKCAKGKTLQETADELAAKGWYPMPPEVRKEKALEDRLKREIATLNAIRQKRGGRAS